MYTEQWGDQNVRRRPSYWLEFEDQPPGHEKHWALAQKILQPTENGFEARLEVDAGGGNFTPYYVIQMRKIIA